MPKIFISYRRADAKDAAGRIYDRLAQAFGDENVFKDVQDIPPGADFRLFIQEEMSRCDIAIIIIGTQWARIMRERSNKPDDFVRIELETALEQRKITIPLLVGGATMPPETVLPPRLRAVFPYLNAFTIGDDPNFRPDMLRLIGHLQSPNLQRPQPLPPNDPTIPAKTAAATAWYRNIPFALLITGILVPIIAALISIAPDLLDRMAAPITLTPDSSALSASNPTPLTPTPDMSTDTATPSKTADVRTDTITPTNTPIDLTPHARLIIGSSGTSIFTEPRESGKTPDYARDIQVSVVGQSAAGDYFLIIFDMRAVWVQNTDAVTLLQDPNSVLPVVEYASPTLTPSAVPPTITPTPIANVPFDLTPQATLRIGSRGTWFFIEPYEGSKILDYAIGIDVPVIAQSAAGDYFLVLFNGRATWAKNTDAITLIKDPNTVLPVVEYTSPTLTPSPTRPTSTPRPTFTPLAVSGLTPLALLSVGNAGTRFLSEPRADSATVGQAYGVTLPVLARNGAGDYYLVVFDERLVWVKTSQFVELLDPNNAVLPVIGYTSPTLTPSPTVVAANSPFEVTPQAFLRISEAGTRFLSEPRADSETVGQAYSVMLPILGRTSLNDYYLILFEGRAVWVKDSQFVELSNPNQATLPIMNNYISPTLEATRTPRPTATPLPTSDAVHGWEIYRQNDFDDERIPLLWSPADYGALSFENGTLIYESRQNYEGGIAVGQNFNNGGYSGNQGVLIRFKYLTLNPSASALNIHFEKGGWLNPEMRLFGITKDAGASDWHVYYINGKEIVNTAKNFDLKPDTPYLIALLIESDTSIRIQIWDISSGFRQVVIDELFNLPDSGWGTKTAAGDYILALKPNMYSTFVIDSVWHLRRVAP